MLKTFIQALVIFLIPTITAGQSLDISVTPESSDNNRSTFMLVGDKVSVNSNSLQFLATGNQVEYQDFGVSSDYSNVSVLQWTEDKGKMVLYNSKGNQLNSFSTITLGDEASFGVYPFNNGNTLLRDKIANFTFYNTFGSIITSTSTSSQSKEGEAISEVAMSRGGETVVLYSPKVKRSGDLGAMAKVMTGDDKFKDIFFSTDRHLRNVIVSDDGGIIVALTAKQGTDDQALIMDRFGNEINTISTDEELIGASVSESAEYLTLYSGGRVMVYSLLSGESHGATSFRSPIFLADYFPSDNLILALTGSYSDRSGTLSGAEIRAVNLEKRAITSENISGSLGFHQAIPVRLERISANKYRLEGGNKELTIEADF